jgi:hypothetical protein
MTWGTEKEQTTIWLGNLRIDEPVAVITDIAVALVCLYAFYELRKLSYRTIVTQLYSYFFLFMGIGTLLGAFVGHAFLYALNPNYRLPGWLFGMLSVTLFERAAIFHAKRIIKPVWGNFFSIINVIELLAFVILACLYLKFVFVEVHAAYGLLLVVPIFEGFYYVRTKNKGSKIILLAILCNIPAAILHMFKFSFSKWLNYFDMGHIIIAISCYIFYIGIKNIPIYETGSKMNEAVSKVD